MTSGASKRLKASVAGILAGATIIGGTTFAASTRRTEKIEVTYDNIQIVVDGEVIEAKDATGKKVEPFIYNGTTYLPVRAVGTAIGKDVAWDGVEKVVYLGAKPGEEENWFSQCPPYQYHNGGVFKFESNQFFVMSGKKYTDGFVLSNAKDCPEALFNLDGQYDSVTFTVGHVDGYANQNPMLEIWLDGEIAFETQLKYDDVAKKITVPLKGALQMKIRLSRAKDYGDNRWGFSEGKFE